MRDLRFALRTLRKNRAFTLAAVLTLGLGIGANAALLSIADTMLFHPFPAIDHPERVVWLFEGGSKVDDERDVVEAGNFADWRAQAHGFEAFGAYQPAHMTLLSGGEPMNLRMSVAVNADYFKVMGLYAAHGRLFTADEEQPGKDGVVVIGDGLWRRRFGGDPTVIGRAIQMNDRSYTVVGVLPAGFLFPREPDVMVPLVLSPEQWRDRKEFGFAAMARLRPDVTLSQAQAELDVISKRLERDHPDTNRELRVHAVPIAVLFGSKAQLVPLLAAVAFVLLIACANVANLQLARGVSRQRELAVRQAMGASRGQLVLQLLGETLLVSLGGAALGLLFAKGGLDLLLASLPVEFTRKIPILRNVGVHMSVFAYAFALALATTLLVGLLPALRSSRIDLVSALKDGAPGSGPGRRRRRLTRALVVGQIALAMLLLAGAGVTVRSFVALMSRPLGFHPEGVFSFELPIGGDASHRAQFMQQLLDRLGPGAAAVSRGVPSTLNGTDEFTIAGRPARSRDEIPAAHSFAVTPDFFRVLELPILRGRAFTRGDHLTVIISDSIARRFFPDQDPLGQHLRIGHGDEHVIVGVSADVPSPNPRSNAQGNLFTPFEGHEELMVLALRSNDPIGFGNLARAAVRELDPQQVIERPQFVDRVVYDRQAGPRMLMWIVTVTSVLALLLASLGIYGLVSYAVQQRTREIGIRIALGARTPAVLATVMRESLVLSAMGLLLGLGLAIPVVRGLSSAFYLREGAGIALPLVATGLLLAAVALVAGFLPARRATRVDPMIALRSE